MDQWINKRLSDCLGFPVPIEMIEYILTLKESYEIDEYFQTLLNFDITEHRLFLNDLKQRILNKKVPSNNNNNNNNINSNDGKSNKKKSILSTHPRQQQHQQNNNKRNDKQKALGLSDKSAVSNSNSSTTASTTATAAAAAGKKKTKYVNLYTQDGEMRGNIILLKGRHSCNCQATKHKLINNCMKCGRIVCEQEGSGPCFFCGNLICSDDELKIIESSTKKGEQLRKTLMQQEMPPAKGLNEAIEMRNRLLEYNRTSEKRTTVIDDESDYFKANSVWLNEDERTKLKTIENRMQEQKHGSRLTRKVTLDFTGRQILDDNSHLSAEYENQLLKEIENASSSNKHQYQNELEYAKQKYNNVDDNNSDMLNPFFNGPSPIFDDSVVYNNDINHKKPSTNFDGVYSRVQDKELLEISDLRNCLSMHQPWASLLVCGIKKHEGRSWYTSHRGRLWIAATAKPVDMNEVRQLEQFYRLYYNDENIKFPSQYPSGCLLGCALVQDCLPQEEYRKQYPNGESDSPFVMICNEPQELIVRFPIKGMHKIYKIDSKIHTAAVKSLQRSAKLRSEEVC